MQINCPDAGRGFASRREPGRPVWSPLNAFLSTLGLFIKDDKLTSAQTYKNLQSYHSWDRLNCFLSVCPLPFNSPGCQCMRPFTDYQAVHSGQCCDYSIKVVLLYFIRNQLFGPIVVFVFLFYIANIGWSCLTYIYFGKIMELLLDDTTFDVTSSFVTVIPYKE